MQCLIFSFCDPTGTRTPNRQLRRLMLYPVELSDPKRLPLAHNCIINLQIYNLPPAIGQI